MRVEETDAQKFRSACAPKSGTPGRPRRALMTPRLEAVSVDCRDPAPLAEFWAAVLGYVVTQVDEDGVAIAAADGSGVTLAFFRAPEHKSLKNRLHFDLRPDDREAEVARVLTLGATRADVGQGPDVSWVVLADPEGKEFCILDGSGRPAG